MVAAVQRMTWRGIVLWMAVAIASFHAAYLLPVPGAGILMLGFLYGLVRLSEADRPRLAFYPALGVGILSYGPQLWFFTGIFGVIAISLWTILALPLGFFVLMVRDLRRQEGGSRWLWAFMVPIFWTGWEYFRCEMNYLKFGWMTPGMAMDGKGLVEIMGSFGVTFVMMAWVAYMVWLPRLPWRERIQSTPWRRGIAMGIVLVTLALAAPWLGAVKYPANMPTFTVVGMQMEEPTEREILNGLDTAVSQHPDVDLLVMSEYTLAQPPTDAIRNWCKVHKRYLVIGGVDLVGPPKGVQKKANTAFVIGPRGDIVFQQVKSVPIQFMDDGIPAKERRVWNSPWGKIAICICYDASYTRVLDDLVRQGAQMIIVPAMDPERWGAYQHELDARVTRVRAAEYHVPIVRVASSGISQVVDRYGQEEARSLFGVFGATVTAKLPWADGVRDAARVPLDRLPAVCCMVITAGTALVMLVGQWSKGSRRKRTVPRESLAGSPLG